MQIAAVAAGGVHSLVLAEDGTVYTTGVNDEGALGRKTGLSSASQPLTWKVHTEVSDCNASRSISLHRLSSAMQIISYGRHLAKKRAVLWRLEATTRGDRLLCPSHMASRQPSQLVRICSLKLVTVKI